MKKYVIAGTGTRGLHMFGKPLVSKYFEFARLAGVFDTNVKRANVFKKMTGGDLEVFEDFDHMLDAVKPDTVIVTTQDAFHDVYIVKALKKGCDVITEKPMTTDEFKCNNILRTERETGKKVTVTFNCRYMPFLLEIKKLMMQNIVGEVTSVHFEWLLDQVHGADYFRRWHSNKRISGGLQIHKATHHFDIINWLIDDEPRIVSAFGSLRFYGSNGTYKGNHCFNCEHKDLCKFYVDKANNPFYKEFYFDNMDIDGYAPDMCVFRNEIDIEDTLSVSVRYKKGAVMSYTLTAYSPYEGYKININGTKGRLEIENYAGKHLKEPVKQVRYFDEEHKMTLIDIEEGRGSHGGGDSALLEVLFKGSDEDPYNRHANSRAGAMSIGIGIAINNSIREQKQIKIKDILWELDVD